MRIPYFLTTIAFIIAISSPFGVSAATAPTLGTEGTFVITSDTFTNSNTAPETIITGDVCYTTGPTTPPLTLTGAVTTPCAPAIGTDQNSALATINGQACTPIGAAVDLNAITIGINPPGTFPPGCYSSTGAMNIVTGTTVTLSGSGPFIFRPGGALTTGNDSSVALTNGANAADVFWAPVGATTLGAYTIGGVPPAAPTFIGNIFRGVASGLSITLGHFANLSGRTLAFGSTVTTDSNTIAIPTASTLGTLHVIKSVSNTGGGTAVAADFSLHVKLAGTDVAGSPLAGAVTPGTAYSLVAGTYVVSEDSNSSYTSSFSGACDSSGNVVLTSNSDMTCTVTNTYIIPPAPVVTSVVATTTTPRSGGNDRNVASAALAVASQPDPATTTLVSSAIIATTTYTIANPVVDPAMTFPNTGFPPEQGSASLDTIILALAALFILGSAAIAWRN